MQSGQASGSALAASTRAALSIDLALTSYAAIGAACVRSDAQGRLDARVLRLPFSGRPAVETLTDWIINTAQQLDIGCIAIDGPMGWRGPDTDSPHCRISERLVRAPGKTGLPPDGVKPRTYLAFTQLSISLFERLTLAGWNLPVTSGADAGPRMLTETFPTAAWRALGLTPLPGKSRSSANDITSAADRLKCTCRIHLDGMETHDDLQAVVGGIAPAWWLAGLTERVRLAGDPPFRLEGSWREGYIMLPHLPDSAHSALPEPGEATPCD